MSAWRRLLPALAAAWAVAGHAGDGTVPSFGLGGQTTQYVQGGSDATKTGWPYGLTPILHVRTYYFDSDSLTGSETAAWALGGWAGLTTGFLGDVFQVGAVGYTSQRLYGPADKDGTKLLLPGQDPINVLGEAFGAIRFADQTLVGYRQLVNRPFVNQYDSRMVPQVFEGYTLRGAPGGVSYLAGYLTKIKVRDSDSYTWMNQAAGATDAHQGMIIGSVTIPFAKDGFVRADEQYVKDTFNTYYLDGRYPVAIGEAATLALAAQYYGQEAVGSKALGDFSTWGLGATGVLTWAGLTAQLAYTQVGRGYEIQYPYGDSPSYANLMQVQFNGAGEKTWLVGASYEFATLGARGLSAGINYAQGRSRIDSSSGAPQPNRHETDVRADYLFPKGSALEGLSATIRYSWLDQDGSPQTATQLRAYLNYEVRF
jgi:hypothetical protein